MRNSKTNVVDNNSFTQDLIWAYNIYYAEMVETKQGASN